MSDTDTDTDAGPPETFNQPNPSQPYLQRGDPSAFGGGYAGATASDDRLSGGDEPPPAAGQIGARMRDTSEIDRGLDMQADDRTPQNQNVAQWGDRWQQQSRSDYIPFGFRRYEPIGLPPIINYIPTAQNPALRDRSPSDWGSPDYVEQGMMKGTDWVQYAPAERDIPGIFHNATMELGRFAPPSIGMPMINGGRSFLAANQNYQRGAIQAAQLNRQQAMDNIKIADHRLEELIRKYGNIFATYGPDPDKPGSDFNADRFHEEIARVASEYGDQYVMNIVNNKDWAALERHLKHLDGTSADLGKALQAIHLAEAKEDLAKKQRENAAAAAEDRKYGVGATTTPTGAKAEEAPPGPEPAPPKSEFEMPVANPDLQRAARGVQMGGKASDYAKSPAARDAIQQQANKLTEAYERLADPNNGLTPEQIRTYAHTMNPSMGQEVDNLLNGLETPTNKDTSRPATRAAMAVAKRINPNYERNAAQQKQRQDFEYKKELARPVVNALGGQMKALSYMRTTLGKNVLDMNQLEGLLQKLSDKGVETGSPYFDAIIRNARSRLGGDPDVAAFETQLALVRSDIGRLLTAGGLAGSGAVYPVSAQKEMREFFDRGISLEQLRSINKQFRQDYQNKLEPMAKEINELNDQVAGIWGRPPPAPVSLDALQDILNNAPRTNSPMDVPLPPMPQGGRRID